MNTPIADFVEAYVNSGIRRLHMPGHKGNGPMGFEKYDITSYSGAVFGMFGGRVERITLSCTNRLANVMLDRFGSNIPILKDGDDRFRITVNVAASPIFYGWVISFGGEVNILSPASAADEIDKLLSGKAE